MTLFIDIPRNNDITNIYYVSERYELLKYTEKNEKSSWAYFLLLDPDYYQKCVGCFLLNDIIWSYWNLGLVSSVLSKIFEISPKYLVSGPT